MDSIHVEDVAHVVHECNRAYCRTLGDDSQKPWDEAPDWQKRSTMDGIQFILKNPGCGPEASHENWLKHKIEEGWKWGPVKNEAKKEHPCMVPHADLPAVQQLKDLLFLAVVRAFFREIS